ncbi:hypothetical protein SFRURICE_020184 [Spodoptera frugiperda]|nr:hypothetical protein SFRURICE_020184 [Spodoptera frugiperda]
MGGGDGDEDDGADPLREGCPQSRRGHHFREQRVKFPKKRRILRPGEVISLAGLPPPLFSFAIEIFTNCSLSLLNDIFENDSLQQEK